MPCEIFIIRFFFLFIFYFSRFYTQSSSLLFSGRSGGVNCLSRLHGELLEPIRHHYHSGYLKRPMKTRHRGKASGVSMPPTDDLYAGVSRTHLEAWLVRLCTFSLHPIPNIRKVIWVFLFILIKICVDQLFFFFQVFISLFLIYLFVFIYIFFSFF